MDDKTQTMPGIDILVTKVLTATEWLNYYKNIWNRNAIARTIDVLTDIELKAKNPDEIVMCDDGGPRPVKNRLELRKELVAESLNLVAAIDKVITTLESGKTMTDSFWSAQFLAVAEDMKPKPVVAAEEQKQEAAAPAGDTAPAAPAEEAKPAQA